MKKVLIITNTLDFGGVERLVVDTSKTLESRGIYHPILCGLLEKNVFKDELGQLNIESCTVNIHKIGDIIPNLFKIRKLIKRLKPDIIHTHQFASDFYGTIGSLGLRIPVVSHLHNPQMESFSRRLMKFILSIFFIKAFIAVIEEKADLLRKWFPSAKVFVLHNAINPSKLLKTKTRRDILDELKIADGSFIIGSVGRFSIEKGYDLLIEAFSLVIKNKNNVVLLLVGDGPEMKKLRGLSKTLGIEDKVIFTGFTKNIANVSSIFNVFVISSRIDSFPIVSIEAMYLEIPVIITDKLSSKDVLSASALVVPCSADGIKEGIINLYKNAELRKSMSIKGLKMVKDNFLMENYVVKLETIYNSIIKKHL